MALIDSWFAASGAKLPLSHTDAVMTPVLVQAYLGDTLYDLYVRTRLALASDATAGQLHRSAIRFVCAEGMARSLMAIEPMLTEGEQAVMRRGRNAKTATTPKHASKTAYHWATGFEALLGYLYLTGQEARAGAIMQAAYESLENEKEA